jgi:hypothetical protein
MPHPPHAPAERFAAIRRSLAQHGAARSTWGISAQVIALLVALIEAIEQCFARLAARVEAGTDAPHPPAPADRASDTAIHQAADQIRPAAAAGAGHRTRPARLKPAARPEAAPEAGRDKPPRRRYERTRPGFYEGLPPLPANATPRKISGGSRPPPPHDHFVTI